MPSPRPGSRARRRRRRPSERGRYPHAARGVCRPPRPRYARTTRRAPPRAGRAHRVHPGSTSATVHPVAAAAPSAASARRPSGTSGGRRIVAHAAQGKHAQLVERPFGHVPPRGAGARDELLWVDVDELELARAVQQVVGHRLGGQVDPERAHAVLLVLQVADAQRRVHVDAGAQKLLGVLVARPVARAFALWARSGSTTTSGRRASAWSRSKGRSRVVCERPSATSTSRPLAISPGPRRAWRRTRPRRAHSQKILRSPRSGAPSSDSVFPPCGAHHGRALH